LLIPGSTPGNKWYDSELEETWIRLDFSFPVNIRKYELKSANDCPHRDPANFALCGLEPEREYLHEVSNFVFKKRYQWKTFNLLDHNKYFSSYELAIAANRGYLDNGGTWIDGT